MLLNIGVLLCLVAVAPAPRVAAAAPNLGRMMLRQLRDLATVLEDVKDLSSSQERLHAGHAELGSKLNTIETEIEKVVQTVTSFESQMAVLLFVVEENQRQLQSLLSVHPETHHVTHPVTREEHTTEAQPTPEPNPGYDCGSHNPCRIAGHSQYYSHKDPGKFVQCGAGNRCFVKSCDSTLIWDQTLLTCTYDYSYNGYD